MTMAQAARNTTSVLKTTTTPTPSSCPVEESADLSRSSRPYPLIVGKLERWQKVQSASFEPSLT